MFYKIKVMLRLKNVILALIVFGAIANSFSQEVLNGFIDKDISLTGTYVIETNVKVTKNATLVINRGSRLLFKKGTSIKIEGGLVIDGSNKKMVEIYSADGKAEGLGIVISGTSQRPIKISYAHFSDLIMPLTFESNWHRKKVSITNCLFDKISTGEPGVVIRKADDIMNSDTIGFYFEYNNFVANNSSIQIETLESDIFKLYFNHNLIFDNYYYGYEVNELYTTPISAAYNSDTRKYKAKISDNVFVGNYLYSNTKDTIVREINFAITGKSERFSVPGNYFGSRSKGRVEQTINHFSNNSSSPFLDVSPLAAAPSSDCHGFIHKVTVNESTLADWGVKPTIESSTPTIKLSFNRPAQLKAGAGVEGGNIKNVVYVFYDETKASFDRANLNATLEWEQDNKQATIKIDDKKIVDFPLGYFIISDFEDNDGFPVPTFSIGKNSYQKNVGFKIANYSPSLRD